MPQPINEIKISGRLVRDIELKTAITSSGKVLEIARFTIAFGYWKGKTLNPCWYFNCTAFGPLAKNMQQLKKGTSIMITRGYLQHNIYKDKEGNPRKDNVIIVEDYFLLKGKSDMAEKMEEEIEQAEDINF